MKSAFRFSFISASIVVLLCFQNCSGKFSASTPSSTILSSLSTPTSTSTTPTASTTAVSTTASATGVSATQFGVVGDGTTDTTAAVQQAIAAAISSGASEVFFPAGTYYIACANAPSMGSCLHITSAQNLTFRGAGTDQTKFVVGNRLTGFLIVENSTNISVRDFSVDYRNLPFTQGTVQSVSANNLQVLFDSTYPSPSMFDAAALAATFAMDFDPATTHLKKNVSNAFFLTSVTQQSGSTWQVGLTSTAGFVAGDRLVIPLRGSSLLTFYRSHTLQLSNVVALASPGLTSAWVQNDGNILIDGFQIRRSGDRLLSSSADGIHMADNNSKVTIRNCYFEGMADDAINTRSSPYPVVSAQSTSVFTFYNQNVSGFKLGQILQIVDHTSQLAKGFGRITTLATSGTNTTVSLDQSIPGIQAGDIVFNSDFAAPNLIVDGNTYSYFRGIFRIRSRGAVLENNTVIDPINAQVLVSADITTAWQEGPSLVNSLDGVYFLNNSVQGGNFSQLQVNYQNIGIPPLSGETALKTHPLVFDVNFYRTYNPDISGMSDAALKDHWINHGIQEGRSGNVSFLANDYLSLYSDIATAYGASNRVGALLHYVEHGATTENRLGSINGNDLVYNAATYRILNSDLNNMSVSQLGAHWLQNGIKEGRRAHLQFSASEYLTLYPDLSKAYGSTNYSGAINHYVTHGALVENRKGTITLNSLVYNEADYLRYNTDLSGDSLEIASHWLLHGISEGRQASSTFSSKYYLAAYPDLVKAFGSQNYAAAIQHYVTAGAAEGRKGVP